MATEVSRQTVRLIDAANIMVTFVTYSDGSIGILSGGSGTGGDATAANQTTELGYLGPGTPYFNSALLATKQAVKASAGRLTYYHIQNPNTSDAWVQFFDVASAGVTVGTTTPTLSLWIPAGGALDVSLSPAANFATAITIAATTTATGSTAPTTGLVVNLLYQ